MKHRIRPILAVIAAAAILPVASRAQMNVREIVDTTDIGQSTYDKDGIFFYQGESVRFTKRIIRDGSTVSIPSTAYPVWRAWLAADPSTYYIEATGSVQSATTGEVRVELDRDESSLTNGTYVSQMSVYSADGTYMGTVYDTSNLVVRAGFTDGATYAGPWSGTVNGLTITNGTFYGDGSGLTNLTGSISDGDKTDITVSGSGETWTIDAGAVTPAKLDRGYLPTATGGIVSNDVRLIAGSDFTVGPVMTDAPTHAALLFIATGGQASAFASDINNDLFGSQWGGAANDPYANLVLAGEDSGIWLIGKHEGSHANSLTLVTLDITNGWDYGFAVGMDTTNATSVGDFYILGGTSQDDMLTSSIFAPFRIDRQTEKVVIGGTTQRLGADLWGGIRIDALQVANSGFNSAWAYTPPSPYGSSGNTAAVIEGADAAAIIVSQDSGGQGSRLVLGEADTSGTFIDGWYWQKYTASGGANSRSTIGYTDSPTNVPLSTATNHNIRLDADGSVTFPNGNGVTVAGPHSAASYSGDGSALTAVDAATGDSATGFFDAGTIEHERGGLEADVSGYANGLYGMLSGATADIDTLAELDTAIGLTGTADSSTYLRGDGAWSAITGGANKVDDSGGNATNLTIAGASTIPTNATLTVENGGAIVVESGGLLVASNGTISVSNIVAQTATVADLTGSNTYANLFADISNTGAYWQADADSMDINVPSGDVIDLKVNDTSVVQANSTGITVAGNGTFQGTVSASHTPYIVATNRTWTTAEMSNGRPKLITATSTQTLGSVSGATTVLDSFTADGTNVVVTIRPNGSDNMRFNGVNDSDGDGIVSDGTADALAVIGYRDGDGWKVWADAAWSAE